MVSIVEWMIGNIYGGGGIGSGLQSVSVGIEKCVPWRIVWGRVGGWGRGRGVRRYDWGNRMGLRQVVFVRRGRLGNGEVGVGALLGVNGG